MLLSVQLTPLRFAIAVSALTISPYIDPHSPPPSLPPAGLGVGCGSITASTVNCTVIYSNAPVKFSAQSLRSALMHGKRTPRDWPTYCIAPDASSVNNGGSSRGGGGGAADGGGGGSAWRFQSDALADSMTTGLAPARVQVSLSGFLHDGTGQFAICDLKAHNPNPPQPALKDCHCNP